MTIIGSIYIKSLCMCALLFNVIGKQNILLIISDDLRTTLGCYGDPIAYTPNVDALSRESVSFLNTYAQVIGTALNSRLGSTKINFIKLTLSSLL